MDDDSDTLKQLGEVLKGHCHIVTTDCGEETLEIAEAVTPDLILVDLLMPNTNGIDVCQTLKQQPDTALVPVLLIASPEAEDLEQQQQQAGATATQ